MEDRKMQDQIIEQQMQPRTFDLSRQQKHGAADVEQLTTFKSHAWALLKGSLIGTSAVVSTRLTDQKQNIYRSTGKCLATTESG